jgi:hypothetical protein
MSRGPELGERVRTPIGAGVVVGWHRSATWLAGRLERRDYVFVELDDGTRLLPVAVVRPAELEHGSEPNHDAADGGRREKP